MHKGLFEAKWNEKIIDNDDVKLTGDSQDVAFLCHYEMLVWSSVTS